MAKKTKSGSDKEAVKKTATSKAAKKSAAKKSTTKKTAAKKKATTKKAATRKSAAKKSTTKKTASKKKTTKKAATKKAATKKATTKKAATKKSAAKKAATKKSTTKKSTRKKTAKKVATKKSTKKRVTKASRAETPADRALRAPGRRGQVAAAKARFEMGEHDPVLREQLGELPPGYSLSIVRAWIRDPRNIAIVWDINDPEMVALAESAGWDAIGVRVIDEGGGIVSDLRVSKRSGIYHLALPGPGLSLRMALGLHREDGFFETLALSGPVRTPPEAPAGDEGEYHTIRLEDDLDRRLLAENEPPPRPGHRAPSALSPGARVRARLELAYRSAVGSTEEPTLAPRIEQALEGGEASAEERVSHSDPGPGPGPGDAAAGERPELRGEAAKGGAKGDALRAGESPGGGVSSAELAGAPSSHSRPTSPGASRR